MRLSKDYPKTIKETVKEYDSISHQLLIQAGFVDQVSSGIFTLLNPGLRVINNIENIIRQAMNQLGAIEIMMPLLHPKFNWEKTKRWHTFDVLFKLLSKTNSEYALAPSHEEIITPLSSKYIISYKDLPAAFYQINIKFRDEPRAKSGILRTREFRMKDLYSFHTIDDDFDAYYQKVMKKYVQIYSDCGLENIKITEASGGNFTKKNSHEFNVLTSAGEANLLYCSSCQFALNYDDIPKKLIACPKCDNKLSQDTAIEVGNIFDLEYKYSEAFNLKYLDITNKKQLVRMGCYGIGTTRMLGAIVEVSHDDNGIIWPTSITPYHVHLVNLNLDTKFSDLIYRTLKAEKIDVLYDDRAEIAGGEKLVIADLIGIPIRLVISPKTKRNIEWKIRSGNKIRMFTPTQVITKTKEVYNL